MSPPPPPAGHRRLLLPAVAFVALLALPAPVALATFAALLAARLAVRLAAGAARRGGLGWARAGGPSAAETTLLGSSPSGAQVLLPDRALAAHGLIVGATGAGKSTTMLAILREQILRGRPVVAIDLKGSPTFARELRAAATDAGRSLRQWSPDGGAYWNPLATGNATELKDKLIATERFTEPHYQRAAERYVQTAIQVLQETAPGRPVTLSGVVEVLEPTRLALRLRWLPGQRRQQVHDYLTSLTADQLSGVRGLATRLAILTESHTGRYLEPSAGGPELDLRRALGSGDGEVVLFSLNSSTYGQLAAQLATLAVQDLVSAAGARLSLGDAGHTAAPAVVAIDEFSALRSENVLALLARGREAGIGVLLATQELADLDRAGRGLRDQVLGNTAVKIAHRQDVPESAETVARLAGTVEVWERTYHERPGPLGGRDLRRSSVRQVQRYVIDPNRVRSLRTGEAAVIVKAPEPSASFARVLPPRPPAAAQAQPDRAQPYRAQPRRVWPGRVRTGRVWPLRHRHLDGPER